MGFAVFNRYHTGIAVLNAGNFAVNILVSNLNGFLPCLNAFITLNGNFRFCCNCSLEIEAILPGRNEFKIDLVFDHFQFGLFDSVLHCLWVNGIDSVLIKNVFTIILFNDFARGLAFAESRNHNFFVFLAVSLLYSIFKRCGIDGNFKLIAVCVHFI